MSTAEKVYLTIVFVLLLLLAFVLSMLIFTQDVEASVQDQISTCNVVLFTCDSTQDCGHPLIHAEIDDVPFWRNHRICEIYARNEANFGMTWVTDATFEYGGIDAYRAAGIHKREAFIQTLSPFVPRIEFAQIKMQRYRFEFLPFICGDKCKSKQLNYPYPYPAP